MAANVIIPIQEMNAFDLPAICLVTGSEDQVTFRPVKFSWYPPAVALLMFMPYLGLPAAIVVSLILRKRARGELPFTDRGWRAWRRARLVWGLAVLFAIPLLFGALVLLVAAASHPGELGWVAVTCLGAGVAVPVVAHFGFVRQRAVRATKITDRELHLRIPEVRVAVAFRQLLYVSPAEPILQATKVA